MRIALGTQLLVAATVVGASALPRPALAAPLTSVGNVYHVGQITGAAGTTDTETRYNLSGTDIGTMFADFAGDVFLAFGDSNGYNAWTGGGGSSWRGNLIAHSHDENPSNGLDLDWMAFDTENRAKICIAHSSGDVGTIPNGGLAVGDSLYVHYQRIKQWGDPGEWTLNGSGMARSVDHGQTWTKTNMWGGSSNFGQAALIRSGSRAYLFGVPGGRSGCVKLARVALTKLETLSSYRYYDGSGWVASESAATCVVPAPAGELSVTYNSFLGRYLMAYLSGWSIVMRTSTSLTGPWSDPVTVPMRYPGLYAPMFLPGQSSGQEIYFALSLWDPYNVFLVHATLNPTSVKYGPFDLPGHVEAENYQEGGEGVGYHDSSAGNWGAFYNTAYRDDDVDTLFEPYKPSFDPVANRAEADAYKVSWIADGEWLSYRVNVLKTGTYKFRMKYIGYSGGCTVQVDAPGGNPVYVWATALPSSGGDYSAFRVWEPISTFTLNAGVQNVNLYFPRGGCDVTSFEIVPAWSGTSLRINSGGSLYINDAGGIWLYDSYVTGGSTSVGTGPVANTLEDGLYQTERHGVFSYAIPVTNGSYRVRLRFYEYWFDAAGQRRFNVNLEGVRRLFDYDVLDRAGGQNVAKDEVLDVYVSDGTLNIDFLQGAADVPTVSAVEVEPGDPDLFMKHRVPGHVEAEHFRVGGNGSAYSDKTTANSGGSYRAGRVDIRTKAGGGHQVGWTETGEWITYDLDVTKTGTYQFRMRYASAAGCSVKIEAPGGSPVYVPATALAGTGGYDSFATWAPINTFTLNAGSRVISIYFAAGGCDVDYFELYQ